MASMNDIDPYLRTLEGAFVLWVITVLNMLSFMTLVDREPSRITRTLGGGVESSPSSGDPRLACDIGSPSQGLYVVPDDACFPLDLTLDSLFLIAPITVVIAFGFLALRYINPINQRFTDRRLTQLITSTSVVIIYTLGYAFSWVLDVRYLPGIGIDRAPEGVLVPNITYILALVAHLVLVAAPFWVYSHSLLPNWTKGWLSRRRARDNIQYFIDANWRRTRLFTTLILTGAIGILLSFVFSLVSPYLLFVLAIVGSVTIGPLGIVWFMMRRIREAEKELRLT